MVKHLQKPMSQPVYLKLPPPHALYDVEHNNVPAVDLLSDPDWWKLTDAEQMYVIIWNSAASSGRLGELRNMGLTLGGSLQSCRTQAQIQAESLSPNFGI